ncbi:MAG: hypothetical protein K2L42_07115 [Clostridia bacterium]|nr:hypothetical protein [Clostridia bacterium]
MAVGLQTIQYYVCTCDKCGVVQNVKKTAELYNGATAVRSIGWKFGKDRSVKCADCRRHDWDDHYQYIAQYKQERKKNVAE